MANKHVCTLADHISDPDLPALPPDATFGQKIRRRFLKFIVVSDRNPRCKLFFRSEEAIYRERIRHATERGNVLIHPLSVFKIYWDLFIINVFLIGLMFIPYEVAFYFKRNPFIHGPRFFVMLFLDIFYSLDIVVTFMTGYVENHLRTIVLNCRRVAKRYVLGPYFFPDLLSSIPFFLLIFTAAGNRRIEIVQLLTLVKGYKSITFLRYIMRCADFFRLTQNTFYFVLFIFLIIIFFHWFCCLHLILPQVRAHLFDGEWNQHSWVMQADLFNYHGFSQYVMCYFRASTLLLCIGNGYYDIKTSEDVIMCIISFLTGYICYSFFFIMVLQILMSQRLSRVKYQMIINQVYEYMRHRKLPLDMQKRLITYYHYKYKKRYFREVGITAALSDLLKKEIILHSCRKLVEKTSLLADLPQNIMSEIISLLKPEWFLPNDVIVKAGTPGDCMYFLASGTVAVLTPNGKEICHLQDGAYFGEISLIMKKQKRVATVVAIEICEAYKLDRKNFLACFSNDSQIYKKIEAVAKQRFVETASLEELHMQFLLEQSRKHALLGH